MRGSVQAFQWKREVRTEPAQLKDAVTKDRGALLKDSLSLQGRRVLLSHHRLRLRQGFCH